MSDYVAVSTDKFEEWLEERVCRPSLEYVPRSIAPNTISMVNALVCWIQFTLAAVSPHLSPLTRIFVLALTGALMFASMVLDCWDGMQARRTGRTSKLGELLDHWLDAIHVPLVTAGLTLMMGMPAWITVIVLVATTMVYNAQLVVYHQTGRFVHPPTSGAQGQFGVAVAFVLSGVFWYFFPRETPWVGWAISVVGLYATYVQLKLCWFYYEMLPKQLSGHYPIIIYGLAMGVLYLLGAMNDLAFVLMGVFLSFRLSGSYVLFTIVKKRFNGNDLVLAGFVVLIAAAHYSGLPPILTAEMADAGLSGLPLALALSYGTCVYIALRNLWDLSRHFEALKPAARMAAS